MGDENWFELETKFTEKGLLNKYRYIYDYLVEKKRFIGYVFKNYKSQQRILCELYE